MSRKLILTAYGTPSDREKLAELAALTRKSQSEVIIDLVRREHERLTKIPRA